MIYDAFLKELDTERLKTDWVRINILDSEENLIRTIDGRAQTGSTITIDGNSSVRRTGNLTIIAEETENDLENIDSDISINKRIQIFKGLSNNIDATRDDIIWFNLGIFVAVDPTISHTVNGVTISITLKDKMCLLNGECGGTLPASVTFHEYDQTVGEQVCLKDPQTDDDMTYDELNTYTVYSYNGVYKMWDDRTGWYDSSAAAIGSTVQQSNRIYDIIQTLVCNYGEESLDKIFINNIDLEIKQLVRYIGNAPLYYNVESHYYTLTEPPEPEIEAGLWKIFHYNEDIGYTYTDFVYPGELISGFGDTVTSVLDKIKDTLGNFEYFYDVNGNFIFQEKKNYLNNSYSSADLLISHRLDDYRKREIDVNNLTVLDDINYVLDLTGTNESIYTFVSKDGLVTSFTNSLSYTNIKNDFHIWGENDNEQIIHYHIAIKEKPIEFGKYYVIYSNDGSTISLADSEKIGITADGVLCFVAPVDEENESVTLIDKNGVYYLETETYATTALEVVEYVPEDWRAELYLRGLEKLRSQQRPTPDEQELLDLFDTIYNFQEKRFKYLSSPNELTYWFDYITPGKNEYGVDNYQESVDNIGRRTYTYQYDKINKLCNLDVPDYILVEALSDDDRNKAVYDEMIKRCTTNDQARIVLSDEIYRNYIAIGTSGYSAQDSARELLYQYTNYGGAINISSIPIYYLEPNNRITVTDNSAGIYGDYVINTISLPLNAQNQMSISASRALTRV